MGCSVQNLPFHWRPAFVGLCCLLVAACSVTAGERSPGDDPLQLTLPPVWYAVPGVEMGLYYDNVVLTQTPQAYGFTVSCDIGQAGERCWTVTPAAEDVGDHPLHLTVADKAGKTVTQGKTLLRVVRPDAGAGGKIRLLIVGDSLTSPGSYPVELARLLRRPGNPNWTMLGARAGREGIRCEGYGGKTWGWFASCYRADSEGVRIKGKKGSGSFCYLGADGKPQTDVSRYIREECGGESPDVVTFLLGINDAFAANPDNPEGLDKRITSILRKADTLLSAFRKAAPKAALAVGITTPPNSRQAAFAHNYGTRYTRWNWKRIQHRLAQREIAHFAGREAEGIFLVPTELNLDPVDGYPENNGVHPNSTGYQQIGRSFYAWLKYWLQNHQGPERPPR